MVRFFLISLQLLSIGAFAQINYEKGYFIDNSGERTECLIKNVDWKNNPSSFSYKADENASVRGAHISEVKEFGIYDISKYVRAEVDIDRSSEQTNELTHERSPIFNLEQLFLKVLVEGKATLYLYEDKNLRRLFYKVSGHPIKQLIYKKYINNGNRILENATFKGQLKASLKCDDISIERFEQINYSKSQIKKLFIKYHECNNFRYVNFEKVTNREIFGLKITPGLDNTSFTIGELNNKNVSFDSKLNFRIGVEFIFIMPFNNKKWQVTIEPTYQYYNVESRTDSISYLRPQNATIDYKAIEIPFGIRHKFFVNKKTSLFLNASYVLSFPFKRIIDYEYSRGFDIKAGSNIAIGGGMQYNKFSFEFRWYGPRDLMINYFDGTSKYQKTSFMLGYRIF